MVRKGVRNDISSEEMSFLAALYIPQPGGYNAAMKPIPINEKLVWDYDIPADAQENEAFREWYVARVLSRGRDDDLRAIGFQTIRDYLPRLLVAARNPRVLGVVFRPAEGASPLWKS